MTKVYHGLSKTKIYRVYTNMMKRCYLKNSIDYSNYGGRGIIVDKKWHTFLSFYRDMNKTYKPNTQLNRINNNGNYTLKNCNWVTKEYNNLNKRQISKKLCRGVYLDTRLKNKYCAKICISGKPYYLGSYKTEKDAYEVFCTIFFEWYGLEAK